MVSISPAVSGTHTTPALITASTVQAAKGCSRASTSTTRSRSVTMPTGTRLPSTSSATTRSPTW